MAHPSSNNQEVNEVHAKITEKIAWLLSKPKRIKIAVGGRGSSKSIGVSDIMLMCADHGEKICCGREYQNSIDDSVHSTLNQEIDRLGLVGFDVLANEIKTATGGEITYKGLARNITSLKSLAGIKRFWIEEGESVSENSLKVLTPSVRSGAKNNDDDSDPPEIWITMNRGSSQDAIAKKYLSRADQALRETGYYEDDIMMAVEVNWRDNPWFPPELEQERLDDYERLSREEYDHIWEGEYNDSVERSIIKPEWFDACIDAHIELGIKARGAKVVAHDPSDEGDDEKGLAYRHGIVVEHVDDSDDGDVNDGMEWALSYTEAIGATHFIWDGDGLGLGLRLQAKEAFDQTTIKYSLFRGGMSPEDADKPYEGAFPVREGKETLNNQDVFRNKRAQYYVRLRDRCYKTYQMIMKKGHYPKDELISFSSNIPKMAKLRAELCRIPTKPNPSGMIQIMSKIEMAKKPLNLPSPNMADSVMMLMMVPTSQAEDNWKQPKVLAKTRASTYNKNQRPKVSTNKRRY